MNAGEGAKRTLTVKAPFEAQPPADLSASVFVFDERGALVASTPLKDGRAAISVPEGAAATRVFVGPTPRADDKPFTLDQLQRMRAYQPAIRIDPKSATVELKPIPQALWQYWHWFLCRIRGKVVKNINGVDLPVCNARVRVCEVEPFWLILQRLPEQQLFTLRDHVLHALNTPSIPIPPPQPSLTTAANPVLGALQPGLRAALRLTPARAASPPAADTLQSSVIPAVAAQAIPAHSVAALSSTSSSLVRDALITNVAILRPYFCIWYWWWWLFERCEEIGTVTTDAQGNFDIDHWELDGDDEDLYFSVEYNIGGIWTSIYAPPIPCNVHWDYQCGSDVTIRITDPRVPACGGDPDLPGKDVVLMTIGNNLSPRQIQASGLTTAGKPFGGSIEPHVAFSRTALIGSGITHYRWSYRRMTLSDGTSDAGIPAGAFTHLQVPVFRHYGLPDPNPPFALSFPAVPMGPDPAFPGADLFKIQPALGPGDGWVVTDGRADTPTAFFLTESLATDPDAAAGKYELKLELFKNDGSLVNFTDEAIMTHLANIDAPFGASTVTTTPADAEHLFVDGTGKTVAMRWVLRIDNNVCHGNINDVQVAGGTLGPCGFYTIASQSATVTVSFSASHPHDFATYDFDMARGSSGVINALSDDGPVAGPSAHSYLHVGTTFSQSYAASVLFNTVDPPAPPPNCDRGAFAEYLYVHAMATDGWSTLTSLDGPRGGPSEIGLKAFALTP